MKYIVSILAERQSLSQLLMQSLTVNKTLNSSANAQSEWTLKIDFESFMRVKTPVSNLYFLHTYGMYNYLHFRESEYYNTKVDTWCTSRRQD